LKFSLAGLRRHPVLLCVPAQPALHAALTEQLERFFALQFLPPESAEPTPPRVGAPDDGAVAANRLIVIQQRRGIV